MISKILHRLCLNFTTDYFLCQFILNNLLMISFCVNAVSDNRIQIYIYGNETVALEQLTWIGIITYKFIYVDVSLIYTENRYFFYISDITNCIFTYCNFIVNFLGVFLLENVDFCSTQCYNDYINFLWYICIHIYNYDIILSL